MQGLCPLEGRKGWKERGGEGKVGPPPNFETVVAPLANTWFQIRQNARHTWLAPDGQTENQIDYIMVDKRYRNGATNSQTRLDADCGSDHSNCKNVYKTTGI